MPNRSIHETPNDPPVDDRTLLLLIRQDVKGLKEDVDDLRATLDTKYVTQDQFWPVKTIVYAGAGIVLVTFLGALAALVIINRGPIKAALSLDRRGESSYAYGGNL